MENTKELNQEKQCDIHVVRRSFWAEFKHPLDKVQRTWLRRFAVVGNLIIIIPLGAIIGAFELSEKWIKECW